MATKCNCAAEPAHADLVADTANLSLHSNATPPSHEECVLHLRSLSTLDMPSTAEAHVVDHGHTRPSPPPPAPSPPPFTPSPPETEPSLYTVSAPNHSPSPKERANLRHRLDTLKTTYADSQAASVVKATYSGGMKTQRTLVSEVVTHGGVTGCPPVLAANVAVAVIKGAKEARQTYKGAEEGRLERLAEEGKLVVGEDGEVFLVRKVEMARDGEVEEAEGGSVWRRARTRVQGGGGGEGEVELEKDKGEGGSAWKRTKAKAKAKASVKAQAEDA